MKENFNDKDELEIGDMSNGPLYGQDNELVVSVSFFCCIFQTLELPVYLPKGIK